MRLQWRYRLSECTMLTAGLSRLTNCDEVIFDQQTLSINYDGLEIFVAMGMGALGGYFIGTTIDLAQNIRRNYRTQQPILEQTVGEA